MNYKEKYRQWLDFADPDTKAELESLTDEKEIEDRFYKDLAFGTGGLRGIMGAGSNRMNRYTVGKATLGLANYLKSTGKADLKVAIAYDSRNNSADFAKTAAGIFANCGLQVYLYDRLVPVPVLSFTTRYLHCDAGVMITASHNPKEYNGYKVYDAKGCQLCTADAAAALDYINAVDDYNAIPFCKDHANIHPVGDRELDAFIAAVEQQSLYTQPSDLKIVYTPLHGTGNVPVRRVLRNMHVSVVKSQELPDGNFSTVRSPNPEEKDALTLAIAQAKAEGADLVLGTDPDCDRVGIAVRDGDDYVLFTGNQTGALLVQFVLTMKKAQLNEKSTLVKTIVTSDLGANIGRSFGLQIEETLTGFKYIGDKINTYEQTGDKEFVIGYEESYGYLVGTHARDKDAVVASMLICEMAAWYKGQGKNLGEALDDLYAQYGFYFNKVDSYTFPGSDGMAKMAALMETLRTELPIAIAGRPVTGHTDYEAGKRYEDGEGETPTGLPASNVMEFRLGKEGSLVARPSGTEPKLKFYYSLRAADRPTAEKAYGEIKASVEDWLGL